MKERGKREEEGEREREREGERGKERVRVEAMKEDGIQGDSTYYARVNAQV